MKSFTFAVAFAALAVVAMAIPMPEAENLAERTIDPAFGLENAEWARQKKSYGSAPSYSAPAAPSYSAPAAPSYGASSYSYSAPGPSIPCSKAVIVSCAPSVIPAPCSAPASGY